MGKPKVEYGALSSNTRLTNKTAKTTTICATLAATNKQGTVEFERITKCIPKVAPQTSSYTLYGFTRAPNTAKVKLVDAFTEADF